MFIPSLIIVVILSFILFLSFNLHNNLFKWLILNLYYISVFTSGIFFLSYRYLLFLITFSVSLKRLFNISFRVSLVLRNLF